MSQILLYSVNPLLKLLIQQQYRNDIHYVWCAETFDSSKQNQYTSQALLPPTSTPADIYRNLAEEVRRGDLHSYKINEQKASLMTRAQEWLSRGEIKETDRDDILHMIKNGGHSQWKPLLYVIPRALVSNRLTHVPASQRANPSAIEYTIADLARSEFDLIEF